MIEETYLNIFLSPDELTNDIKKIIKEKLNNKYLFKEINARMITNIELIYDLKSIPLSKSFINHKGDVKSFVISCDIICEILNSDIIPKIKSNNYIKVRLQNIKSTNGCFYFIAQGYIIL